MTDGEPRILPEIAAAAPVTPAQRAAAYGVHLFTACGVVFAFLAAAEVCAPSPNPRKVFLYLAIQVLIDALDGPLARAVHIKVRAARIDGRTIDDIVDYLTYTFIPLLLVWRMGWLPAPADGRAADGIAAGGLIAGAIVAAAMVASLFGFANAAAKDEKHGFFLGFPSYWNIIAFYVGIWHAWFGPWPGAVVIVALTLLTVLPVRFIYPNLAPRPFKMPTLAGAAIWGVMLIWMAVRYPAPPRWLMWLSLVYPAFYVALSAGLDITSRRRMRPDR